MKATVWFPLVCALVCAGYIGSKMRPMPKDGEMDIESFAKIPVQFEGRYMPLDTFARHHMLILSNRESYQTGERGTFGPKSFPAIKWYLQVAAGQERAEHLKIIRVDSPHVWQFLELERRPGDWRYSKDELIMKFMRKGSDIQAILSKSRSKKALTEQERQIEAIFNQVQLVEALGRLHLVGIIPDPSPENSGTWLSPFDVDRMNAEPFFIQAKAEAPMIMKRRLQENREEVERMSKMNEKALAAELEMREQRAMRDRLEELVNQNRPLFAPQSAAFHKIFSAYASGNAEDFNSAVKAYRETYVDKLQDEEIGRTGLEYSLNRLAPFAICTGFYILVMVFSAFSWIGWQKPLLNAALSVGGVTLLLHTGALVARVIISGKPPVTNLYSSAVFIGWGALILSLGMDIYYRNGLGSFVGGLLGMLSMLVATFLEGNGDTMPRVQAVLNTNFWLASHVTIVTLGYMATFVAGFVAILYLICGVFTNLLSEDRGRSWYGTMYGVTCFATLLSFVGTVLGGFWADDSWGRFWGWDPKENGAVLIVMWNALNLHLRWAGLVKARGFAVMAIFGNMVTAWSWFGTNQLGIGLHAYGFDDKLAQGVTLFWITQLCAAGLGLIPQRFWASFAKPNTPAKNG